MYKVHNEDLNNSDFELNIKMEADGAKVFEYDLTSLKLFLKVDILQIIQNFFSNNWPEYDTKEGAEDLPTYHEADIGNYPRYEMVMNLNDCLICFEQMNDFRIMEQHFLMMQNSTFPEDFDKNMSDFGGPPAAFKRMGTGFSS